MSKKTKKAPLTPPTVLTVTLNADGRGSLVVKRGDLAAISQFTFHSMGDLFTAIQAGAATLVAVEKDPPPKDVGLAQPAPAAVPAIPEEAAVTADEAEDPTETAETVIPVSSVVPTEPVEGDSLVSAAAALPVVTPAANPDSVTAAIQPLAAASSTNQLNLL